MADAKVQRLRDKVPCLPDESFELQNTRNINSFLSLQVIQISISQSIAVLHIPQSFRHKKRLKR